MSLVLLLLQSVIVFGAPKRVLITGFEPFLNFTDNPSGTVAKMLDKQCNTLTIYTLGQKSEVSLCFDGLVLPVSHTGASTVATLLDTKKFEYDAVLHMGLESEAKGLKLELVGANVMADTRNEPIVPNGPAVLPSTLDLGHFTLEDIAQSLEGVGISLQQLGLVSPSQAWSRDAGTYYCNETLFRTLMAILRNSFKRGASLLPAIFVHLPNSTTVDVHQDAQIVSIVAAHLVSQQSS